MKRLKFHFIFATVYQITHAPIFLLTDFAYFDIINYN